MIRSNTKDVWTIGKSIGVGGFGEIYLCCTGETKCGDNAPFAVKIEPHENGPLFVEMNFYLRTAKSEMVEDFCKKKGLRSFGMPILRGSGNHMFKGDKYRFLVMDRYSKDLDKIFQGGKEVFSQQTAFQLAIKIIDTLEYIHSKGYAHNDIKAQNLMLGHGSSKENDVYLVDFGLVSKYQRGEEQTHIEYKPDLRFAHDGTIEYLSRDAHQGIKARRSDLEILCYNLIHWLSGHLPWMEVLRDPKKVQAMKETFMSNLSSQLPKCFGNSSCPKALKDLLDYVNDLEFKQQPNYDKCRSFFEKALKNEGMKLDGKISFGKVSSDDVGAKKTPAKRKSPRQIKKPSYTDSASQTSPNFVATARAAAKARKDAAIAENKEKEPFLTPAKKATKTTKGKTSLKKKGSNLDDVENNMPMDNPTPAMIELMKKKEAANAAKSASKRKPVLSKISSTSPSCSKKYKM